MASRMCAGPANDNQIDGRPTCHEDYDGWMNKFCAEPPGDTETCCLAFWVPCVLYGKIDERLERVKHGKDPNNVGNGCNPSCLIWSIAACGFCGGMTGNRRTRVRGVYDINGELCDDCVTSYFCNMCVLMQTDREIRAREGQISLRTSPGYKQTAPIDAQPVSQKPMRYLSPRETASSSNPDASFSNQTRSHEACSGTAQAQQPVAGSHNLTKASKSCCHAKKKKTDQKKPAIIGRSDENKAPQHSKKKKNGRQMASQQEKISNPMSKIGSPDRLGTELATVPEKKSSFNESAVNHNADEKESPVEIGRPSSPGGSHVIAECVGIEIDIEMARKKAEHPLAKCDTLDVVDERGTADTVAHPTQELSYVHDFTDCPVDKDVLKYYEQEEEQTQTRGQALEVQAETSFHENPPEVPGHLLQDCPQYVSFNKVTTEIPQHDLAECHERDSVTVIVPNETLQQHDLAECHRGSFAASSQGRDHTVSESIRAASAPLSKNYPQHELADCTRASSLAVPVSQSLPAEQADCCREEPNPIVDVAEHDLTDCPSTYALDRATTDSQHDETEANAQTESSVPLEVATVEQHDLSDCPLPSDASLPLNNPYRSYAHGIEDCDNSQDNPRSSQSSGTEQSTEIGKEKQYSGNLKVRKRSKKNNKGKQRANNNEHTHLICQPCEHVTFKAAERQNSKLVYAAVIHDNSGSKPTGGKSKIPDTDGGRSSRPSQVCGSSAQNALEKVLAESETRRKDHFQADADGHCGRRGSLQVQESVDTSLMEKARENGPEKARRRSSIGDIVIRGMTGLTDKSKN